MSDKKLEECSLGESTHVEINGCVVEIKEGGMVEKSLNCGTIHILVGENNWANIPKEAFLFFGIKPFKEIKPEPIVFEATFAHYDGKWHPLYSLDDGVSYQNCKKARFRCVQIMEDEE
jgi:hypothetical protein